MKEQMKGAAEPRRRRSSGLPWLSRLVRFYLTYFPLRNGKGRVYQAVQDKLLPPERWVTLKVRQGFWLRLDLLDPAQRYIYFFGEYDERHEIKLLTRLLRPGDRVWDVGANIGYYTLIAAGLVGPRGQVVAFEPAAHAWRALRDNVALNPQAPIRLERLALSDKGGQATLHRHADYADGGASLQARPGYHQDTELVATTTLDNYLAQSQGQPPTLLKIDVEGHEESVLRGGQKLLTGPQAPILLLEMNEPARLGQFLQAAGYQGCYRHRRRWRLADNPLIAPSRNMLWLRPDNPEHRERLPFIGVCACNLWARCRAAG